LAHSPALNPSTQAHGGNVVGRFVWRTQPMHVDRKLALRLSLIAALPEPILLERLRRLSKAELTVSGGATAFASAVAQAAARCRGPRNSHRAFAPACCSTHARAAERPAEHVPDTLPVRRLPAARPAYPVLGAPASREVAGAGRRDSATSTQDEAESEAHGARPGRVGGGTSGGWPKASAQTHGARRPWASPAVGSRRRSLNTQAAG
jgi:hypothetical protein